MAKILFVPSALNEVPTIAMVREHLDADLRENITAIALYQNIEALLKRKGFFCRHLSDYPHHNALDILRTEGPALLLTNDFTDICRAFIFAAGYLKLPALSVDDGVTVNVPARTGELWYSPQRLAPRRVLRWLKDKDRFQRFRDLIFTFRTLRAIEGLNPARMWQEIDRRFPRPTIKILKFAVAGESAKKIYIERGFPPENIFVTGQPRFDALFTQKFNKEKTMAELGIPAGKKIAVLATQGQIYRTEKEQRELVETVVKATAEFPELQLVIKPHPQEDPQYYSRLLKMMGQGGPIVRQDIDLYQLLNASDLLITAFSTTALEAMLLDKPVITINLTGQPDLMPYASSGAAIGVYRREDLVPAMRKALFDAEMRKALAEGRKAFISEHAYKPDGQASKRVAEVIHKLIKEQQE